MTAKQALKKAQGIWGKHACVESRKTPLTHTTKTGKTWVVHERFTVGLIHMGMFFSVRGHGKTWEEAFTNAEARK